MKLNAFLEQTIASCPEDLKTLDDVEVCYLNEFNSDNNKSYIVVDDSLTPREVIANVHQKQISHLVQRNNASFAADLRLAASLVKAKEKYFERGNLLIVDEQVTTTHIEFNSRDEKERVFNEAAGFVKQLKSRITSYATIAIMEELYMNATLDAPKEAERLGIKSSGGPIDLQLSFNKTHLQISCTDTYGSLDLPKVVKRMDEVYQKGAGKAINFQGIGGAGIGCYILFEHCSTLIFGVLKGKKTKVTCLIPLNVSNIEMNSIKKSMHGFEV